ncbi:MAG: hypothetical protein ACHQ53_17330 [Polyangiales bacterium]
MKRSLQLVGLVAMFAGLATVHVTLVAAQSGQAGSPEAMPPEPPPAEGAPAAPGPAPAPAPTPAALPSIYGPNAGPVAPVDTRRTAMNVLYAELLGNGGIYSIDYERFFTDDIAARIGFGYISLSASSGTSSAHASILFIPVMFNYMGVGSADHKLELGLGPLLVNASAGASGVGKAAAHASGFGVAGTATIGYRYVPHDGGFNFKIGFTPIFGAGGFLPWGGLGLGAVF